MIRLKRTLATGIGLLLAGAMAAGQAKVSSPAATSSQTSSTLPESSLPDAPSAASKQILGVISNVKTVQDPDAPFHALTAGEKFKLVGGFFNVGTIFGSAIGAGLTAATDGKPDYERDGAKGYAKRFGADVGDSFTAEVFVTGVFPSLLHEDPRYFRQDRGSFFSRTLHAVSHILITRTDSGANTFNFSEFLGTLASSGISNAYYPDRERGWGDVFSRMGSKIGGDAAGLVFREFAPDIVRKLRHKKKNMDAPAAAEIPAVGAPK